MKVVFVGAGASIPAGYPSAAALLDHVGKSAEESPDQSVKDAWHRFHNFRDRATGMASRILGSSNPEIVLSLPDLYRAADANEDQDLGRALAKAEDDSDLLEQKERLRTKPTEFLEAEIAVRDCLYCLEHFFWERHCLDGGCEASKRDYLREELFPLAAGDVIATTNWDTLVERLLAEDGLWAPHDGYGFTADLFCDGLLKTPAREILAPSTVTVLKLHGSLGWHQSKKGNSVVLSQARLLQDLRLAGRDGRRLILRDRAEPYGELPGDWIALYPSYLKKLTSEPMYDIWALASQALGRAAEVRIIGYSFPESDLAVQVLVNAVRSRVKSGKVNLVVVNPSREAIERARRLVGGTIADQQRMIGPTTP